MSEDFGQTFSPARPLESTPDRILGSPSVASDCHGNVYVAWADVPTLVSVSHDFGRTWPLDPFTVEPFGSSRVTVVADDNEHAFVFYSVGQVRMDYSQDGGRTFLDADIPASLRPAELFSAAIDGQGHCAVTYVTFDAPISTFVRIGHADVGFRLTSGTPPETRIVVPAEGGEIPLDGVVRNQSSTSLSAVPAVLDALAPDGSVLRVLARKRFHLLPGGVRQRSITRGIPAALPPGLYRWRLTLEEPVEDRAYICIEKR